MMRLAIFISGSGTTAESIVRAGIKPVIVISSRPDAGGIGKMKKLGIAVKVVNHSSELLPVLEKAGVDVISQNGWLPLTPGNVIRKYKGKIINQHPGPLDPGRDMDFGGKGMYGRRVIAARIAFCRLSGRDFWTEATVHHVTEGFDRGPIIRVERLAIPKNSKSLVEITQKVANALLPLEHKNVITILKDYAARGKFMEYKRKIPLVGAKEKTVLEKSKKMAIELFSKG